MESKTKLKLTRATTGKTAQLPIKVLQFGEGNFLRAFVDYAFLTLNKELDFNAGFAVIKTLSGEMLILSKNKIVIHLVFKWS